MSVSIKKLISKSLSLSGGDFLCLTVDKYIR